MLKKSNKLKTGLLAIALAFAGSFLGSSFMQGVSVEATSVKTIKGAYREYLEKKISEKKYFKIVNIEVNGKPVLLVGKKKSEAPVNTYISCSIYYYKNGKVKKMGSFTGGRNLNLSEKKGKLYLTNGGSDFSRHVCIRKGKLYRYEYYNNHNWKTNKGDKWKASVVKADGKVVKNFGYLEADQYNAKRDSYTYKDTSLKFMKNTAKNRNKI